PHKRTRASILIHNKLLVPSREKLAQHQPRLISSLPVGAAAAVLLSDSTSHASVHRRGALRLTGPPRYCVTGATRAMAEGHFLSFSHFIQSFATSPAALVHVCCHRFSPDENQNTLPNKNENILPNIDYAWACLDVRLRFGINHCIVLLSVYIYQCIYYAWAVLYNTCISPFGGCCMGRALDGLALSYILCVFRPLARVPWRTAYVRGYNSG
ncbi:hypothetical protein U9M48_001827, partial [Paspalum notatum var. saurae]